MSITIKRALGTTIPDLQINGKPAPYPVLNERAVRAGAGIMLAIGLFGFIMAFFYGNFIYLQTIVTLFMIDFGVRIFINPAYSPIGFLARMTVAHQRPEWVGAIQKRFAWSIGFVLATTMFVLLLFGVRGTTNLVICGICLSVMYLETSFGFCVGCKIYNWLVSKGILKAPQHKPACVGGSCEL